MITPSALHARILRRLSLCLLWTNANLVLSYGIFSIMAARFHWTWRINKAAWISICWEATKRCHTKHGSNRIYSFRLNLWDFISGIGVSRGPLCMRYHGNLIFHLNYLGPKQGAPISPHSPDLANSYRARGFKLGRASCWGVGLAVTSSLVELLVGCWLAVTQLG